MKRKLFIVITLILITILAACSPKVISKDFDFEDYKTNYTNLNPTKYIRTSSIYADDVLLSRETKEYIKAQETVYEKIISETISIYSIDMIVSVEEYYYQDNTIWEKIDEEWISYIGEAQDAPALRLNREYFEAIDITRTENGSELVATVKEDMKTLFLQESPTFANNIIIKLTETEGKIREFFMNYYTNNHYIEIQVDYFYTAETLTTPIIQP